jgi:hypothetical protein
MQVSVTVPRTTRNHDYPWYDSLWLSNYHRAIDMIRAVAPGREREFEDALRRLRTRTDFDVQVLEQLFDEDTLVEIGGVAAALSPSQLELHEARSFKRFIVHDHPYFTALQQRIVDLVSEAAGEAVESSYNFLSLYGPAGVCPLHLDAPVAKWTLDLCLRQSNPWPIHFGPVIDWPEAGHHGANWESEVKDALAGNVRTHTQQPGQALLFAGSSQWHYRDPMPGAGSSRYCDLLFFHFLPRGMSEVAKPDNWARLFGVPELNEVVTKGSAAVRLGS